MVRNGFLLPVLAAGAMAAGNSSPTQTAHAASEVLDPSPLKQEFEGWILACDNVRVCRAQPRNSIGAVTIRREPGPEGRIAVLLGGPEPSDGQMTANLRSIRIGGAPSTAPWRLVEDVATLQGEPALAFARALTRAASLSFEAGGDGPYEISLAGLPAALRAMDAAQGQEGGEAAFVSIGPRPPADVPAAAARPVILVVRPAWPTNLPADFAAQVRRTARPAAECEAETRDLDEVHPLNSAEALVILECGHGPTNSSYLLLRVPRHAAAQAMPIALPWVPGADDGHEDMAGLYTTSNGIRRGDHSPP
jgi:hypothetical protein